MDTRRCAFAGLAVLVFVGVMAVAPAGAQQAKPASAAEYDIILRGGRVVDGTGNPWFVGDVGIRGGRIAALGRLAGATAKREIDATGLVVAPGFIDMHSHSDAPLLYDGRGEGKLRQGVTLEVLGEAGSAAPRCPRGETQEGEGPYGLTYDWTDFDGYFGRLLRQGISLNVGSFVAAGQVRRCAVGNDNREATAEEMEAMKAMVEAAMRQGALGLSAGLIYPPGSFAPTEELIELARVAAAHGGIYSAHIRSEGDRVLEAIAETVRIGEEAGLPVHIMHLKASAKRNWGRMPEIVAAIEAAQRRGIEIHADQYPYIASSTGLSARLPNWTQDGGTAAMVARLKDPETRARIRTAVERGGVFYAQDSLIAYLRTEANKKYEGMTIAQVAEERGTDPIETMFDLLVEENGSVSMIYFVMSEKDVRYAMQRPWVSVGSDGSALRPDGELARGKPHPRSYGSFPRVLGKYVREEGILTLEEAVRKMTSLAAQQLGVWDRGLLRAGMVADVVVFDANRITDKATFTDPHQFSEGVEYVVVSGELVLDKGEHTGAMPGKIVYGAGRK